jgi:hypothetical protein
MENMSAEEAKNYARLVRQQRNPDDKLDQLSLAIEHLADAVATIDADVLAISAYLNEQRKPRPIDAA